MSCGCLKLASGTAGGDLMTLEKIMLLLGRIFEHYTECVHSMLMGLVLFFSSSTAPEKCEYLTSIPQRVIDMSKCKVLHVQRTHKMA